MRNVPQMLAVRFDDDGPTKLMSAKNKVSTQSINWAIAIPFKIFRIATNSRRAWRLGAL